MFKSLSKKVFSAVLLICVYPSLRSQDLSETHTEVPDDPYVFVDRESMERGPSYRINGSDFFTRQVNVDSNGNDILGDAANEPSIAVDPTNPNRIVIGWRQFDTVTSNFRQAGNGFSLDGGLTWEFPGVLDPGFFRSDPVLDFDANGNFYYNSLRGGFNCDVYKITNGGVDWGAPFPAYGGDKQWMRIDKTNGISARNNYSNWNPSFTTCSPGFFTRSTDGSNTFENCSLIDSNPIWGTLAVDSDGVLYITGKYGSDVVLVKSSTAQDPNISPVTWDSVSTVDLDGRIWAQVPPNPSGLMGQVWVDVDISNGPGQNNVYVLASVNRNSISDPGDVMFARSTDNGNNFDAPQRINDDVGETAYQWFGTMSVAPNGRIDVAWLDTRDAPSGTNLSALYFTYSEDQGVTWSGNLKLSDQFDPNIGYPQQNKMGDYFDMVSDNNGAHLAWVNTFNGGQDVYYSHITPSLLGITTFASEVVDNLKCVPNPFKDQTTIQFTSKKDQNVRVEIFDISGRIMKTLLNESVQGAQQLVWDGTNIQNVKVQSGLYFVRLSASETTKVSRLILE
ncbi:T9SS type A sorting domain-containing protein [Ulvibacter antarcticus]|uniref:Putative secreted protein (Por secretion system target) n=1 Tax=Ulvibacter antarcticus TaxID=442714 RepID=A0A3L9YX49_9FLAO|nr:T9SS type A sorting domain-containing protein [Ulvibacter antarcticus]RMA64407.1 putative secreted protein (Por secretion system target) [Ulvibacter antarcticus]